MRKLMRVVSAVLWSLIGLGGRSIDAEKRAESVGILQLIFVALVIVALLVVLLIAIARTVASA